MKQAILNSHLNRNSHWRIGLLFTLSAFVLAAMSGCGTQSSSAPPPTTGKVIQAVGAENEYADIIKQIGGKYVAVTAIMNNPGADPHSYEANTQDATLIGNATLIVQNGLGYDDFMDKLESGSPNSGRTVIDVAKALGYSEDTPNPHLWYKPDTMPKVAGLVAKDLETRMPGQKEYFADQLTRFDSSLSTWNNDLNQLRQAYDGAAVAVTEPVADYMLVAAHLDIKTPWGFQAAVMNGTDPSPQDVETQESLLKDRKVKVLIYNQQAIDDVTTTLLHLAKSNHIPVVGVYETMPADHTYQTWMEDEATSVLRALKDGVSTEVIS